MGTPECKVHLWPEVLRHLRRMILDCGLTEEVKWSMPCYTWQGANVLILAAFKEYASISFFKGALLQDDQGLLVKQGENTQAARLLKFTRVEDLLELEPVVKAYIFEAIEVEKAGLKVEMKDKDELVLPEELVWRMEENPELKAAFEALTPGRQRGYCLHFTGAKQSKTREARIEKCIPKIMAGLGFFD